MKDVPPKAPKDRSNFFLGTILAAFVVVVLALMLATAHSFAGRMPVPVNHFSGDRLMLHQRFACLVVGEYRVEGWQRCGTKSLASD